MNHEQAAVRIVDLDKGRLDPVEEREVREHADACEECRSVSRTYALLLAGSKAESGAHPVPALIVRFALSLPALGETERQRVEEHVRSCASCAREAAAVREAESSLAAPVGPSIRPRTRWWGAIAAGIVLVLFGEVVRLHRSRDSGLRPAEGVFGLSLLTGALREGDEPAIVDVAAGQETVALAVAPALPAELPGSVTLSVRIVGKDGDETFTRDVRAEELRKLSGASGVFALFVPASKLSAGPFTLYIQAQSDQQPLFRKVFAVRRAE